MDQVKQHFTGRIATGYLYTIAIAADACQVSILLAPVPEACVFSLQFG